MSFNATDKKYTKYLKNGSWTLCLGAGICYDILPTWFQLTNTVINKTFGTSLNEKEFKALVDSVGFSLDSWIQNAYNYHISENNSSESFNKILEESLYSDLLNKADKKGLKEPFLKLFFNTKRLKKEEVFACCDFFEDNYEGSTLIQLVKILLNEDLNRPSAIIIFNADTLLSALIQLFSIKKHYEETGVYDFPPEDFKKIIYKFQSYNTKIPIFHIHGTIYPPFANKKRKMDSRHNLIFLESSYADVASSMYSWAQTTFLYYSSNTSMVFVGLSMSDPNIRKWLTWSTSAKNSEIDFVFHNSEKNITTRNNIWLRDKPKDKLELKILEESLLHLGTKIGWLKDWTELGVALRNLMKT